VVLENVFTDKTNGILQQVHVNYHLLPKGLYAPTDGSKTIEFPITDREHTPLALYEPITRSVLRSRWVRTSMRRTL